MKNIIKLNTQINIDLAKMIAGKLLLQAGSGGGKSYAIRRLLEQSFGLIPHIILDTEGEFSSLREKYDYILIGKGYDIAADPKTAALMALRLWERRVSAIIDLYELDPDDRQKFVDTFIGAMINAPKNLWKPVLLVIDEAHEYAPENEKSQYGLSMLRLASKGRKRHIAAIFATQSIASLSKRIVASCKNKLIGYASETNDVKRAAFELGMTPQEGLQLRDLDPGEFYAFGPAISKQVIKVKIGSVKTTHEQSTTGIVKVAPPSDKVKEELAALADLPQIAEEEARTVAELKAKVRDLERTLRQQKPVAQDPDTLKKITDKAFDLGVESMKHQMHIEQKETKKIIDAANATIRKLSQGFISIVKIAKQHEEVPMFRMSENQTLFTPPPVRPTSFVKIDKDTFKNTKYEVRNEPKELNVSSMFEGRGTPLSGLNFPDSTKRTPIVEASLSTTEAQVSLPSTSGERAPLSKGARDVLTYLHSRYPHWKSKAQCWIATGYAPGGGFNNIMYEVTGAGYVEKDGSGAYAAVQNAYSESLLNERFDSHIEKWDTKLSVGARKVFRILTDASHLTFSKGDLAQMTGYARGGGFNNIIYELTGKQLAIKVGVSYQFNPEILDL